MMEWFGKIKDLLSLGSKQVFIVALAAWVLLLLPGPVAETMGVASLRDQYRPIIGLVALLATVWLVALPLYEVGGWVRKQVHDRRFDRAAVN